MFPPVTSELKLSLRKTLITLAIYLGLSGTEAKAVAEVRAGVSGTAFAAHGSRRLHQILPGRSFPAVVTATSVGNFRRQPSQEQSFDCCMKMAPNEEVVSVSPEKSVPPAIQGYLSLIGKSTSAAVALTFFAVLAYRRDALMVTFFIGAIGNGIAGKILKRLLDQDRPEELELNGDIKLKPGDKGMPSSHAMSLGFICTFTALGIPWTAVPLLIYVILSLYYRVKANLHTFEQIVVGLVFGVINGILWRDLALGVSPLFPSVHIMQSISDHLIPPGGVLPAPYLVVPAAVGAVVVGSFERKMSRWLAQFKAEDKDE